MSPIILLFDLRAETVSRVGDANQEAPDIADVKAIRVDENGLLVCGWMRLSSTRRPSWLSYPTGDAANIADAILFTDSERYRGASRFPKKSSSSSKWRSSTREEYRS